MVSASTVFHLQHQWRSEQRFSQRVGPTLSNALCALIKRSVRSQPFCRQTLLMYGENVLSHWGQRSVHVSFCRFMCVYLIFYSLCADIYTKLCICNYKSCHFIHWLSQNIFDNIIWKLEVLSKLLQCLFVCSVDFILKPLTSDSFDIKRKASLKFRAGAVHRFGPYIMHQKNSTDCWWIFYVL